MARQLPTHTRLQPGLQAGQLLRLLLSDLGQVRRRRVRFQRLCHIQLILARSLGSSRGNQMDLFN